MRKKCYVVRNYVVTVRMTKNMASVSMCELPISHKQSFKNSAIMEAHSPSACQVLGLIPGYTRIGKVASCLQVTSGIFCRILTI